MSDRELLDGPWWMLTLMRVELPGATPTYHTAVTQEHPAAFIMRSNRVFKKLGDTVVHYLIHSVQIPESLVDEAIVAFPEY